MASCHLILLVILTYFSRNHALVPGIKFRSAGNKVYQKIAKDSSGLLEYRTSNAEKEIFELRNGLQVRRLKSRQGKFSIQNQKIRRYSIYLGKNAKNPIFENFPLTAKVWLNKSG